MLTSMLSASGVGSIENLVSFGDIGMPFEMSDLDACFAMPNEDLICEFPDSLACPTGVASEMLFDSASVRPTGFSVSSNVAAKALKRR